MKIGYDAKRAALNPVGLGNYSRSLIQLMKRLYPENDYFLYSPAPFSKEVLSDFNERDFHLRHPEKPLPRPMRGLYSLFKTPFNVGRDQLDLFHGLSHTLPPFLNCKSVVTIHDLIFLKHPEWYSKFDVFNYARRFKKACDRADCILSVSESTKKDLVDFFAISPSKIHVTYQSISEEFNSKKPKDSLLEAVRKKHQLPDRFILSVGTLEERKNLKRLIAAYLKASKHFPDVKLVIVGKSPHSYQSTFKKLTQLEELKNKVLFLGFVPQEDLPTLYHLAEIFAYIPLYEGFGIPILEALFCETPVLTSNCSSLPEVAGHAGLTCDPLDVDAIAFAMQCMIQDPTQCIRLREAIPEHLKRFEPKAIAQAIHSAYLSIL